MLPDADDLPDLLLDLAVPHEDINEVTARLRTVTTDPGVRRLLDECAEDVTSVVREADDPTGLGDRAAHAPAALGEYFLVYAFLVAVPHVRAAHRELGIPGDITRMTLTDLGRGMALHRRRYGRGGLGARQAHWLTRHFCGRLYQLGRLQYERAGLGTRTAQAITSAGIPVAAAAPSLNLHIPDFLGPLTPAACDRSVLRAREFFARYFPDEKPVVATCHSWLLDPQLRRHLPADSNIIRFQERFRPGWDDREPADTTPVAFVFGDPDLPASDLPRRTSLERAVGDRLRAGGHWYIGHGWFPWER
ncbi:acyltransferase domain-containing protein [Streptomyces sp. NPDC006654]|uniref:acyltransferase domain-containing protein n=1 Tax=unclassified Streptomyces TaxID=2593676 RepID=UPI0033C263B2